MSDRYERCERLMSPTPHSLSMSAPLIALKTTPRRLALVSRPPVLTLTKDGPHSPTRAVLYYLCVSGSLRTNKDAAGSHGHHPPPPCSPSRPPSTPSCWCFLEMGFEESQQSLQIHSRVWRDHWGWRRGGGGGGRDERDALSSKEKRKRERELWEEGGGGW